MNVISFAQKTDSIHCKNMNIPNLDEKQKTKIEEIHKFHKEKVQLNKKMLEEKNAQFQEMRVSDNPDINALNAKIDEITAVKGKMMKERELMVQDIRKLLNSEQRAFYDNSMKHKMNRNNFKGKGGKHCPNMK